MFDVQTRCSLWVDMKCFIYTSFAILVIELDTHSLPVLWQVMFNHLVDILLTT